MASSLPKETPQTPAKCQFCEESTDIGWNCITCELYLCHSCSVKIHSKIKSSTAHQIINLRDYKSEDLATFSRQADLESMKCCVHEGQKCISYCSDCEMAICFKCTREVHLEHQLYDMHEIYQEKIFKMKDLCEKIHIDIPFFKAQKMKLQQMLAKTKKVHNEVIDKIQAQEKVLNDAVTRVAQDLLQKCDSIYNSTEIKIENELSIIQKSEDELMRRKDDFDKVYLSRKASDVLNQSKSLETKLPEKTECKITLPQAEFIPGEIQDLELSRNFGDLYNIDGLQLVQTYDTDLRAVESIVNVDDTVNFIGTSLSKKLQKVKFENDKTTIVKEEDIKVYDMAMMDNGDILISSLNSELRQYTKDGTLKSYKDFSPLQTLGVHINKHNEILVGLGESGSIDIKPNIIRKVVVLNQGEEIIHTYERDRNNQRLFTWPFRITTSDDNIFIIDWLKRSNEGRLVVLDYRGQVKWFYAGGDKLKFYPGGITVTTSGRILILGRKNHSIHELNQRGELVLCHQVKDMAIELPLSVAIDVSGFLWVGCNTTSNDNPRRAKLHKYAIS